MLSVYTNNKELLKATNTVPVSRLESLDRELLDSRKFSLTFKDGYRPNLELHVYTPDGVYLYGNHEALYSVENNDTTSQLVPYQHLSIDTSTELEKLGITRGQFKLVYNLFDNVIGSFNGQKLWIKEISPSRRELRIQLSDNTSTTLLSQLDTFKKRWTALESDNIFNSFVLNFGFNETYQIINVKFLTEYTDTPEILVKLYNPLPAKYGEKSKIWISEEVINPILETVSIVPKHIPEPVTTLAPPNFDLEEYEGGSVATTFKSWNDLLSENIQTSQQLIDAQFSGSLSGIKLNINYRNFENFVHYSSAVERVNNFKYKMELIEYYSDRIQTVSQINGGDITQTNLSDLYNNRNKVVSGFDDFEKYLFFESTGSKLYTHFELSGSYGGITGNIDPWPKTTAPNLTWAQAYMLWSNAATTWTQGTAPDPYGYFATQVLTTSAEGVSWYNDLIELATAYDKFNVHKLQNTIPSHIQNSGDNDDFILFVNMLGQHFDILWTYIKDLTTIKSREEHPKDGMPNDLLYHVANSMGFSLLNGKSASDLWKYSLGVDENGVALQDDVNGITSISDESNTKEIWRRIVNNLPYILKSKGTSRSVKALLSCFGIPSTVLTIKEYGGPSTTTDNDHFPEFVHDVYHYGWLSTTGSLTIPGNRTFDNGHGINVTPNTLEFRFKPDTNFTYNTGYEYGIASSQDDEHQLFLRKDSEDDQEGTLYYVDGTNELSASNLQIFDNSWHSVSLEKVWDRTGSYTEVNILDTTTDGYSTLVSGTDVYTYDVIGANQAETYWRQGSQLNIGSFTVNHTSNLSWIQVNSDLTANIAPGLASIWDSGNLLGFVLIKTVQWDNANTTIEFFDHDAYYQNMTITDISENAVYPWKGNLIKVDTVTDGDHLSSNPGAASCTKLTFLGKSLLHDQKFNLSGVSSYGVAIPLLNTDDLSVGTAVYIGYGTIDYYNTITTAATEYNSIDTNLKVAKSLYGKSIYIKSGSSNYIDSGSYSLDKGWYLALSGSSMPSGIVFASGSRNLPSTITFAGGNDSVATITKFNGHFHEVRLWSGSLNDNTLKEHAASPATYTYNVDREALTNGSEAGKPYDHLLQRYTLANKVILSGSFYQTSVHPNQTLNTGSLYFNGYTSSGSITFEGFEETYHTPSPSLGGSSLYTNKIRVESSSLDSNARLNTKTRIEKSSFDRYSLDSNRVGVYFSPQTAINEDIFNQLGYFEIDDYIGNPNDLYSDHYADLNNFAISYWKKYENRNDFEAYFRALEIYDFTLFKYIKRLLPQRSNAIVGLVVEPNVLERSKVKLLNKPTIENLTYNADIDRYLPDIASEYHSIEGTLDSVYPDATSEVVDANMGIGEIAYSPSIETEFQSIESTIEGAINVDRLGDSWIQHRYVGIYKLTETGSYDILQTVVLDSTPSRYLLTIGDYFYSSSLSASLGLPYSSSLVPAEINNFYGTGHENSKWNGSKLVGSAINVNSPNTIDGGPVVKVTTVNPNAIVFANNQVTTIDQSVSGIKKKSI